MPRYRNLNADFILANAETLHRRVEERFPERGISRVCLEVVDVAREARHKALWIAAPHWWLRIGIMLVILVTITLLILLIININIDTNITNIADFLEAVDAALNDLILLGAAMFFLVKSEARVKRHRALESLHELRSLAHVIDMHQLTKDPERFLTSWHGTASSPHLTMTAFELTRYLDYCSEMLSLIGKIAALHVQKFDDEVALAAVYEIEHLTTGLSRKIWQKIMIIQGLKGEVAEDETNLGEFTSPESE